MDNQAYRQDWFDKTRLTVVVGHFGSGKSEFSLNLALLLSQRHPTALADLDIVDPYFRSRECEAELMKRNIRLISSSQACQDADVPAIPPDVYTLFDNKTLHGVMDIGGDASGARVLARYRKRLVEDGANIWCVVNANRPLSDTPEKAEAYVRSIEAGAGVRITGLVNNTHLCGETQLEDVLAGAELAQALSKNTGIPIVCHLAPEGLAEEAAKHVSPVFPIHLFLKKPWEL